MCTTLGGCGPARARSFNNEAGEDDYPPMVADTVHDDIGRLQQRPGALIDYSIVPDSYNDRSTMVLKNYNQPLMQDSVYDAKPRPVIEYAY